MPEPSGFSLSTTGIARWSGFSLDINTATATPPGQPCASIGSGTPVRTLGTPLVYPAIVMPGGIGNALTTSRKPDTPAVDETSTVPGRLAVAILPPLDT